jgi:hypothetical protein
MVLELPLEPLQEGFAQVLSTSLSGEEVQNFLTNFAETHSVPL